MSYEDLYSLSFTLVKGESLRRRLRSVGMDAPAGISIKLTWFWMKIQVRITTLGLELLCFSSFSAVRASHFGETRSTPLERVREMLIARFLL